MFYTFGQQASNAMKPMLLAFWVKNAKTNVSRQTLFFAFECFTANIVKPKNTKTNVSRQTLVFKILNKTNKDRFEK